MLHWLSLTVVLAASHITFADVCLESEEPGDALHQCQARAWVRAPDMVPGDVIAGDVKVKLIGPCPDAESYVLGLRYKERIFWKLRRQDAPLPDAPEWKGRPEELDDDIFQIRTPGWNPEYDETEWMEYTKSFQNKDLWTVHEEERVAFEIKTTLVSADSLPSSFISQFGILVPNTNYPPGLDHRHSMNSMVTTDIISGESIYEYFVEIKFNNGSTSDIPAGITAFVPSYDLIENDALPVNVSLMPMRAPVPAGTLQSNYTIELSFPGGARVNQSSSLNLMAIAHRTGYTNRTDTPVRLCLFMDEYVSVEWRPQELKDRVPSSREFVLTLVAPFYTASDTPEPCGEVKFAKPVDSTGEGHISSTSSEPISLSLPASHRIAPGFLTYYHKLENHVVLDLSIEPDPSELDDDCGREQWDSEIMGMDESDFDWVPWSPTPTWTPHISYEGNAGISVIPMQKQGLRLRSTPVHYLSEEARQPAFVAFSDIPGLHLMSPEERDSIAPLAQPYTRVFASGEELRIRYFARDDIIYVGNTWFRKVIAKEQREADNMDHLLVVQ